MLILKNGRLPRYAGGEVGTRIVCVGRKWFYVPLSGTNFVDVGMISQIMAISIS